MERRGGIIYTAKKLTFGQSSVTHIKEKGAVFQGDRRLYLSRDKANTGHRDGSGDEEILSIIAILSQFIWAVL